MSKRNVLGKWYGKDSREFATLHKYLLDSAHVDARKIGISSAGNLKYTVGRDSKQYVVPIQTLPQSIIQALQLERDTLPQLKIVKQAIVDFATKEPYAARFDQLWNELCKKAGIMGTITRRADPNEQRGTYNGSDYILRGFPIMRIYYRKDGDYTEYWETVYQQDIEDICTQVNKARKSEAIASACTFISHELQKDLEAEARVIFNAPVEKVLPDKQTLGKNNIQTFAFTCTMICQDNGIAIARGDVRGTCTPDNRAVQLIMDQKPVAAFPNANDRTMLHEFYFTRGEAADCGHCGTCSLENKANIYLDDYFKSELIAFLSSTYSTLIPYMSKPSFYKMPPFAKSKQDVLSSIELQYDWQQKQMDISCVYGTIRYDDNDGFKFVKYTKPFAILQSFSTFVTRWNECADIAKEYEQVQPDNEHKLRISLSSGKGIAVGDTKLTFSCYGRSVKVEFQIPESDDLDEYSTAVREAFVSGYQQLVQIYKAEIEQLREAKQGMYEHICGDPLEIALLRFISANEGYITSTAVQQALRGVKVQLNTKITDTDGCGHFNFLSGEDIDREIHNLAYDGFLELKTLRGTFGRFDVIHMTKLGRDALQYAEKSLLLAPQTEKWWEYPAAYKNALNIIRRKLDQNEDARQEQVELLHHLDNRHMVAYFHDDIVDAFPKEDTDLCKLIKIYRSMQSEDSLAWNMLGHILRGRHLNKTE